MDFSAGMLAKAEARVASLPTGSAPVRFVRHDVRDPWPVEDASVDLVVVMLVLEHVERVEPAFAEAARALRPGGELFVCELHPFRQMDGRQAEYTSTTGDRVRVAAFLHDVSDYANAAIAAGLTLTRLAEWRDEGVALPRLLTLHADKRA
jgi:ubiquinone/menaquinone biosynthesis C-methylase UbiE